MGHVRAHMLCTRAFSSLLLCPAHEHCCFPTCSISGRTYRYWRGQRPLFPFGFGLSYVQWQLSDAALSAAGNGSSGGSSGGGSDADAGAHAGGSVVDLEGESVALEAAITVTNAGSAGSSSGSSSGSSNGSSNGSEGGDGTGGNLTASTSVLLFMRLLDSSPQLDSGGGRDGGDSGTAGGPASQLPLATVSGSGCSWAANSTDVVQQLVGYARTEQLAPGASQRLTFQLQLSPPVEGYSASASGSSWAGFGDLDPEPPCGLYGLRFGHDQPDAALVLLD